VIHRRGNGVNCCNGEVIHCLNELRHFIRIFFPDTAIVDFDWKN
jgi:hypothetical protein